MTPRFSPTKNLSTSELRHASCFYPNKTQIAAMLLDRICPKTGNEVNYVWKQHTIIKKKI